MKLCWYFYNGRVPVPVKLPDGRIYSVRPRGYLFTDATSIRKYGAKFVACATPQNASEILSLLGLPVEAAPTVKALAKSYEPRNKVAEVTTKTPMKRSTRKKRGVNNA